MTAPARTGPGWPRALATAAGVYAVLGGTLTLMGWAANLQRLTDWKNDGISMFANTAGCVLGGGVALLLSNLSSRRRPAAIRGISGVVLAVGALTLFENLSGIDVGIDRLLIERPWGRGAATAPMRMGLPASTSFIMIGAALWLLTLGPRARRASAVLGVAVIAIATLSLTGHLYGAQQMYTLPRLTSIAMQTASMILALGIGLVASVPEEEPVRTILDPGAAGALARRVLPVIIVFPLALGWWRILIQEQGLVDAAFGTALGTLIEVVLLTALLWRAIAMIRAHERALGASEREVRLQARQIGAFLETAAIGLHRAGADGIILWANDAELRLLGYSPDEYIGHHVAEFHVDPDVIADVLARLHRGETVLDAAARMRCKDGSIKSVLIDASVLWDEGRFVHTQCFTRDVTDRGKAEEVQALLAGIIEASGDAIVSKTLEGVVTSWNAGAQRIFGYTAAEMIGKPIDILIPPDRHDEEREILARLRRGERIEHYETVRRTKDDRAIDISLTISPVRDRTGRIIGASKIARDITERKLAEAEREESNRRKDEFIAILAHELRNPLAPVRTAASHLMKKVAHDPELRRPLAIIERQVAQMSRLIDDLLDVSRISRGTLELRRDRVTCSEIVEAAVDACRDELQAKRHRLRVSLPPETVELEADRERLVQVLCNLVGNAAKYTPPGGEIELTVAVPGSTLEVSVKDNGIGIPPGKLTEIFDLFARVDHPLERQGGLGIGLTLVRQLAELHGGTVEARSRGLGHGSEFLIRLPAVAATAPAEAVVEQTPAGAPLRILVADDNHDAVESLVLLLRLAGHEVEAAFDGEGAIKCAETFLPEVALVDIGMPHANGYDVARRIREQAWGAGIYLVALTGWGQEADKHRAQEAGFDAHLVKPVPPEALDRLLATIGGADPAPAVRGTG